MAQGASGASCRSLKASDTKVSRPASSHPEADSGCSHAQPRSACKSRTSRRRSTAQPYPCTTDPRIVVSANGHDVVVDLETIAGRV